MVDNKAPIRWARRVTPHKIRALYASDARGIVDEELIDVRMNAAIALLNDLAYGDLSTPGMGEGRATWKGRLDVARQAMHEHQQERAKKLDKPPA